MPRCGRPARRAVSRPVCADEKNPALSVDRKLRGASTVGPHTAQPAPAVAPHDPPRQADACRSAIGRPILENPLFSQASMSAAAVAPSSRASLNQRITRRCTRSVRAARLAGVIGRAGRNAGGASQPVSAAAGTKTPSVTQAWRCTWWLSAEPKRCRKEMPPSRGRVALGMSASGSPPASASRSRSISSRKVFVSALTARGRSASMPRKRLGTEITHCRTGTGELVQIHDDRDVFQASPDELPAIDIHSL